MDLTFFKSKSSIQKEWKKKVISYASAINSYVEKGFRDGWDKVGKAPSGKGLEPLARFAIEAVREANRDGNVEGLRESWPPTHHPLLKLLEKNQQSIPVVCMLKEDHIIARIGAEYENGYVVQIQGNNVSRVDNIEFFGYCPNKRFFATSTAVGISVTLGWLGEEVLFCPWPKGTENAPPGFELTPFETPPRPTRLIPFPDGKRLLLISSKGIFVLTDNSAVRLSPTTTSLEEYGKWLIKENSSTPMSIDISMEHGAISSDGKWIAVGEQDEQHFIYNSQLELVGKIEPQSEYPHYALFSSDGSMLAFNSCHFYGGITLGVLLEDVREMKMKDQISDSLIRILETNSRVYAGVSRGQEFIIGDADGYLRAFDQNGTRTWQLFIGSSICDIDLSPDGKQLVVSTYAGYISIIVFDTDSVPPYQIGTAKHTELRRWLFWLNEEKPLIW